MAGAGEDGRAGGENSHDGVGGECNGIGETSRVVYREIC